MRPTDMAAPFCVLMAARIAEVQPLEGLLRVGGGLGDVEAVGLGHHLHALQGADLLLHLLARRMTSSVIVPSPQLAKSSGLLVLDQVVDAVQGNAAVVADDAAAAIGIGQAGDDVAVAASPHLGGVGIEHAWLWVGRTSVKLSYSSRRPCSRAGWQPGKPCGCHR